MPPRPLEIAAFLEQHGWGRAETQALNGDFSTRRYARLTKEPGQTAFLMDADEDQKTPQFVGVAKILRSLGIKAPEIYAADAGRGLVLMEDFGSRNIGALIDGGEAPLPYFLRAADLLAKVHRAFDPMAANNADLPLFDADAFTAQAELFLDAYFPVAMGREASDEERGDFCAAWQTTLRFIDDMPRSLMLRDFMPDNLMDLPNNEIGVLDFQDAGIGPVAYDLASLCEEVRRDGGADLLPQVIDRYLAAAQSSISKSDMLRACTVLSAQRHMRILGIISRLCTRAGQCDKFAFLPRIRHYLEMLLIDPALLLVRAWIETFDRILQ